MIHNRIEGLEEQYAPGSSTGKMLELNSGTCSWNYPYSELLSSQRLHCNIYFTCNGSIYTEKLQYLIFMGN